MDKAIEKIKEYGLQAMRFFSTKEIEDINKVISEMTKEPNIQEVNLDRLIRRHINIFVGETDKFKQKFNVPAGYDEIVDEFLEEMSLEIDSDGQFRFETHLSTNEIAQLFSQMLESNETGFWKKNKAWALKKTFSPETVVKEFSLRQAILLEDLVTELNRNPVLDTFRKELQSACNDVWTEKNKKTTAIEN